MHTGPGCLLKNGSSSGERPSPLSPLLPMAPTARTAIIRINSRAITSKRDYSKRSPTARPASRLVTTGSLFFCRPRTDSRCLRPSTTFIASSPRLLLHACAHGTSEACRFRRSQLSLGSLCYLLRTSPCRIGSILARTCSTGPPSPGSPSSFWPGSDSSPRSRRPIRLTPLPRRGGSLWSKKSSTAWKRSKRRCRRCAAASPVPRTRAPTRSFRISWSRSSIGSYGEQRRGSGCGRALWRRAVSSSRCRFSKPRARSKDPTKPSKHFETIFSAGKRSSTKSTRFLFGSRFDWNRRPLPTRSAPEISPEISMTQSKPRATTTGSWVSFCKR